MRKTLHKHLKQLVRSRMAKTGESYSSARRALIAARSQASSKDRSYSPGSVPATTALRTLLRHAGVHGPGTKAAYTEAMLFVIAGGVGIGAFSFVYEQADFASLFLGGRHLWHDDLAYLQSACKRLGVQTVIRESTAPGKAAKDLAAALAEHGPCIAWVDAASLPHRAMPALWSGGGYHVVNVCSIEGDHALIGDLTDEPIRISLKDLAVARNRIKKQKNRLLSIAAACPPVDDGPAMLDGLRACCGGLLGRGGVKSAATNFSLDGLRRLAERIHGATGKESWDHVFAPGHRLWNAMVSLHDFLEHHGTGGGLCRPIFAEGLAEAAAALRDPRLAAVALRYADLGRQWQALADRALPDDVPLCRAAKAKLTHKAEVIDSGGDQDDIRAAWDELAKLAEQAKREFPLSATAAEQWRAEVKQRVLHLHDGEVAARQELAQIVGA